MDVGLGRGCCLAYLPTLEYAVVAQTYCRQKTAAFMNDYMNVERHVLEA